LAKNRVAMLDMMNILRFLKGRKLELCAEKTKIVVRGWSQKYPT